MATIRFTVNGQVHSITTEPERPLLEVLREDLGLTGTKYGCGEGQCGACTVLVGNQPRRSCVTPIGSVQHQEVTTIEGLAAAGRLHPVQQAFLDAEALQCGYCTSGMIMSAVAFLRMKSDPGEIEIAHFMEGNVCRCGTYPRIVAAVRRAAELLRKTRP